MLAKILLGPCKVTKILRGCLAVQFVVCFDGLAQLSDGQPMRLRSSELARADLVRADFLHFLSQELFRFLRLRCPCRLAVLFAVQAVGNPLHTAALIDSALSAHYLPPFLPFDLSHLARIAFCAISLRRAADSFFLRACPPSDASSLTVISFFFMESPFLPASIHACKYGVKGYFCGAPVPLSIRWARGICR